MERYTALFLLQLPFKNEFSFESLAHEAAVLSYLSDI